MRTIIFIVFLMIVLSGCATHSPAHIMTMNEDELVSVPDMALCGAYTFTPQKVEPEMRRRNLLPEWEWDLVAEQKVQVGMSACGAVASWGKPSTVNTTSTRYGARHQWVYRRGYYGTSTSYLYFEKGRLTAIQN